MTSIGARWIWPPSRIAAATAARLPTPTGSHADRHCFRQHCYDSKYLTHRRSVQVRYRSLNHAERSYSKSRAVADYSAAHRRGLGLALTKELLSRGSTVYATTRSPPNEGEMPAGAKVIEVGHCFQSGSFAPCPLLLKLNVATNCFQ